MGKCLNPLVYIEVWSETGNKVTDGSIGNAGVFVYPGISYDEYEK
jgi:hypothetical protein